MKNIRKKSWLFVLVVILAIGAIGTVALATRPSTLIVFDPKGQAISSINKEGVASCSWDCIEPEKYLILGDMQSVLGVFEVQYTTLYADDPTRAILWVAGEPRAVLVAGQDSLGFGITAIVIGPDGRESRVWSRASICNGRTYIHPTGLFTILEDLGFPLTYISDGVWFWQTSN